MPEFKYGEKRTCDICGGDHAAYACKEKVDTDARGKKQIKGRADWKEQAKAKSSLQREGIIGKETLKEVSVEELHRDRREK